MWLIHPEYLGALYLYTVFNEGLYQKHKERVLYKLHAAISQVTNVSNKILEVLQKKHNPNDP